MSDTPQPSETALRIQTRSLCARILVRAIPFVALFLCAFASFADTLRFVALRREVIVERLHSCPSRNSDREAQLNTYFTTSGCKGPALALDKPRHSSLGNVVCTLPGSSEQEIVVGAHFDHVHAGMGAIDNWSGASLLPSLYEALASQPHKHTFVFIAFYGEEDGLVGSSHYVHELGKEKLAQIDAMVNMDSLGTGPTEVWVSHADPRLANLALVISRSLKLPLSGMNVERVGSTDSESFREKKVPTICFHALTQATLPLLHSSQDQLSQIKEDDFYASYRLIAAYLAYLDTAVPDRSHAK
jgi:putative aminopeptidase FrvX